MRTRRKLSRWLVFAPVAVLGWFAPQPAQAQVYGVSVTAYSNLGFNNAPPLPSEEQTVGTVIQSDIWHDFDQYPMFNLYEDFVIKYESFITAPCTCNVQFMVQADDGTILSLDGETVTSDWYDKGGGGSTSQPISFTEGVSKQLTLWFYENGGGAWVQMWWLVSDTWEIVPDTAFTLQKLQINTTTSTTTTMPIETIAPTSSEIPLPSTTEIPATTTLPPSTSTTLLVTTTSSSTTTIAVPTTVISTSTSLPNVITTTTSTTTTTVAAPTTAEEVFASAENMTTEQVREAVDDIVSDGISPDEAIVLATTPEAIKQLTAEEATQVFDSLDIEELSDEQTALLVAVVQDAPQEVREAFEEAIDIFAGATDTYVPVGSTVPVATRRAIIAVAGVITIASSVTSATSASNKR